MSSGNPAARIARSIPSRRSGKASSMAAMNMSPATPPTASRWKCTGSLLCPLHPLLRREGPGLRAPSGVHGFLVLAQHRVERAFGVELERLGLAHHIELRWVGAHLPYERLGDVDVHQLQGVADAHDPAILR